MALTRAYEENEVSPELRRIYAGIRADFDLPFVPTLFKVAAGIPEYLRLMWDDLEHVAGSREFHSASRALQEFAQVQLVTEGWRISDQRRVLAGQRFSSTDVEALGGIVSAFAKALPQMTLFARLMQLGYSGGQPGRVGSANHPSPISRMITFNIPNERDSGLRAWLIYADIKKTTGCRSVFSFFRALSPFPGYLASVWMDSKKLMKEPGFQRSREELAKRSRALLNGLPVRDHRKHGKNISPEEWREIEETVDGFVRLLPQFSLLVAAWQRSFSSGFGAGSIRVA
jgi:Halocarboxylic acid dehydrogenase DehI